MGFHTGFYLFYGFLLVFVFLFFMELLCRFLLGFYGFKYNQGGRGVLEGREGGKYRVGYL